VTEKLLARKKRGCLSLAGYDGVDATVEACEARFDFLGQGYRGVISLVDGRLRIIAGHPQQLVARVQ